MRRTQWSECAAGLGGEFFEGVDDGGGVIDHALPGDEAGENDGDADVEDGADDEGSKDADGDVALGIAALFAGGRDGVEADVGEEDDGAAGEDAGPAVRREGVVEGGLDEVRAGADEEEDGAEFEQDHDVVGAGGLADATDEDDGDEEDDEEGGDVEAEVPAGGVDVVAGEILEAAGEVGGGDPAGGGVDAEPVEEVHYVCREAYGHAHVGAGVLEDEVPADDPGDELAEGGVGVGVGGAGDGDHGRELGVAEAGERADDGDEDERDGEGGAGAGSAGEGGVVNEVVGDGRVEEGGGVELFAGDGGADDGEDARPDDGADAEGGEGDGAEGFLERVLGALGGVDELVDGLGGEDLSGQRRGSSAVSLGCGVSVTLHDAGVQTQRGPRGSGRLLGGAWPSGVEWCGLALGGAACGLLDLLLVFAAGAGALGLGRGGFAGGALDLFAFFGVGDGLGVCHGSGCL